MLIARISRLSGDKVVKDEIKTEDLLELLELLECYIGRDILEIHIFKEGEK